MNDTASSARRRCAVPVGALALVLTALGFLAPSPSGAMTTAQADRIVHVARSYVGHARYAEGGTSPKQGFDCSGYTEYVFAKARVATLPHSAEGQRHLRRMHVVSRKHARRGDLVFYLDGGRAYHVAIYAGHGMQYSAATRRDGIRYQHVWSNAVQYKRYR